MNFTVMTWQSAPAGLVRADMTPKPAYEELMKRVKGAWWTKTVATVGENGEVRFRGFFGDYEVRLDTSKRAVSPVVDEHELTGSFSFNKAAQGPVKVELGIWP